MRYWWSCRLRLVFATFVAVGLTAVVGGVTPSRARAEGSTSCSTTAVTCRDLTVRHGELPPGFVAAGVPFQLRLIVTNAASGRPAQVSAGARLLRESLPSGLRYTGYSAPSGYTCSAPGAGVTVVDCTATSVDTIAPGASRRFHLHMDWDFGKTLNFAGIGTTITSSATVDPGAVIAETREDNNSDSEIYRVLATDLNVRQDCTPPGTFLTPDSAWGCRIRIQNRATATSPAVIVPRPEILMTVTLHGFSASSLTTPGGMKCTKSTSSATSSTFRCNATGIVVIPVGGEIVFQLQAVTRATEGQFDSTVVMHVPNQSYRLLDYARQRSSEEAVEQGSSSPYNSTQGGFVDFG